MLFHATTAKVNMALHHCPYVTSSKSLIKIFYVIHYQRIRYYNCLNSIDRTKQAKIWLNNDIVFSLTRNEIVRIFPCGLLMFEFPSAIASYSL